MNEHISSKLYALDSFQQQYKKLLVYSVLNQFSNLNNDLHEIIDFNNILSIASILSKSDDTVHIETALRIAQTMLNYKLSNESQRDACAVILNNLTNNRTIELAIDKKLIEANYFDNFSSILQLKTIKNNLNNTVIVNGKIISLNSFQTEVYAKIKHNQFVSISSPTSSGKSFILSQILLNQIIKNNTSIVYLVPTRALINQVENDIRVLLKKENVNNVYLSTVPKLPEEDFSKIIYVLTQERLHWFLVDGELKIDMLIVDEAQQIEHGHRGVLVEEKIIEVIEKNENVQVIFASPFSKNPEILFENLPDIKNKTHSKVVKDYIAVNQNLLFVSSERSSTKKWHMDLISNIGQFKLINFNFDESIQEGQRLTKIITILGNKEGGNLIYQYKPSYTEQEALKLYNFLNDPIIDNEQINNLIKLIKDTIHPNYKLVEVLKKRIAFHYGNMPLLIRQEIERLFEIGEIKYIFCTSTLLEGVNLPAKNIFIRKPKRASTIKMTQTDFWNLAGRAGRLGKEFQGNIICIDTDKWDETPSLANKKNEIVKATTIINNHFTEFLKFIMDATPRNKLSQSEYMSYEYAFNFYYTRWLDHKLDNILQDKSKIELLEKEFNKIRDKITIPDNIIKKHVGISPLAQQELYDYFSQANNFETFIPYDIHSDDAIQSFKGTVSIINQYLSGDFDGLSYYHASLIVRWIRGYKLSYIIQKSIQYFRKHKPEKKRDTIIREVMSDVETFARFKFAKYSACYMDLLKLVLIQKGQQSLLDEIPELTIWLEFGVSQKSQLSFIELGLSRNTAILLSEYTPNANMTRKECQIWLQKQDLESLELSPILINEIKGKL